MTRWLAPVVVALAGLAAVLAQDQTQQAAQKERLAEMQPLVGSWRGVGQPQRASTKDSWVENAEWAWSFGKDGPALVAKLPNGKYFKQLTIVPGENSGQFTLTAISAASDNTIRYRGAVDGDQPLIFEAEKAQDDVPQRLSFRFVASGDRLLVLVEKKSPATGQLARLAEIGYTRHGSGFGKGVTQRECIVTGGLGTIEVAYGGKTYYVCCTGCRDYFNEKPAEVLAEYASRKAAEKSVK
jgi:hypothetical protein